MPSTLFPLASGAQSGAAKGDKKPVPALRPPVFAFDLDGTVTTCEILPRIARLAGIESRMALLTRLTLSGHLSFAASFRHRFAMLRHLPLALVHRELEGVPFDPDIEAFIKSRPKDCVLVTGNLDLWIGPLVSRLGCRCFASRGMITSRGLKLLSVLDKGRVAALLKREGRRLIAVGESVSDVPLLSAAAVGIAFSGVHRPVREVLLVARHEAHDGPSLCALLKKVAGLPASESRCRETPDGPDRGKARRPGCL
jgi:HAD superfamily phosphoserine phosphatase-like hydrolase